MADGLTRTAPRRRRAGAAVVTLLLGGGAVALVRTVRRVVWLALGLGWAHPAVHAVTPPPIPLRRHGVPRLGATVRVPEQREVSACRCRADPDRSATWRPR
jgi:hypothetical protein